jgi:hypothetical protein
LNPEQRGVFPLVAYKAAAMTMMMMMMMPLVLLYNILYFDVFFYLDVECGSLDQREQHSYTEGV